MALHPVTVSGDKQITEVLFYEFRFCNESCVCFANIVDSVCLHFANKPLFIPLNLPGCGLFVASPYQLIPLLWQRVLQIFIY